VFASGIPPGEAEARAVTNGTAIEDRAIADHLQNAVQVLDDAPDPAHRAAVSVEVRLGLLVDAEAARAAEAARLAVSKPAADELLDAAKTLALIGEQLWDPQLLGERDTPIAGDRIVLALHTRL
jgi:hypothetical protein